MLLTSSMILSHLKKTPTRFVAIALLGLGLTGCGQSGPKLADVEGVVTLDGKPLEGVMLEFQPQGGKGSPSVGYTDKNGEYRLRFSRDRWGAVPGTHVVRIDHDWEPGNDQPKPAFKIPAQYNKQSDIRRDLQPGNNSLSFELSSKEMVAQGSKKTRTR